METQVPGEKPRSNFLIFTKDTRGKINKHAYDKKERKSGSILPWAKPTSSNTPPQVGT